MTLGAGGGEVGVGNAGFDAGAGLDHDLGAQGFQLLDGFRRGGDPIFGGVGLTRDGNAHYPVSSWLTTKLDAGFGDALQPEAAKASASSESTTMTTLGAFAPVARP